MGKILCMNNKSDLIFQNRALPLYKNFFQKTFVQYVTVRLVRIRTYKNAYEKEQTFPWRRKNAQKRRKSDEK